MDVPAISHSVQRIISGGQTGVDRGALDAAISLGIEHGGWCPRGRLAEDGVIPEMYKLRETESPEYPNRTEQNVIDADGTLILYDTSIRGGTELTLRLAKKHNKPHLLVDLGRRGGTPAVRRWISANNIRVLNVAGPRESTVEGISARAQLFIRKLLS